MNTINPNTAVDSAELVIAGENDDLVGAAVADSQVSALDMVPGADLPAEGTVSMYRKADGKLLATWTEEYWDKSIEYCREWLAEKERVYAENLKFDTNALAALRAACRSPACDATLEQVASAAAYFGTDAGMPILREFVARNCPLVPDLDYTVGDLWYEACEQRGDTFEDWEKASHEPGGWRWLVRRVRELEGGGEPPKPAPVGAVPEASHLTTDQMNAARLAAQFGGKELLASARSFYVWQGTHWERDPSEATRYGAQLSHIVREEAKGWRAKFEALAAADPRGKKLEATDRRDRAPCRTPCSKPRRGATW